MRRAVVVCASAGGAILGVGSLMFLIIAFSSYRNKDFLTATSTEDFTTLGTCVGVVTKKQLDSANYDNPSCSSGATKRMRKTLLVSVHPLYYTYFTAKQTDESVERLMRATLGAVINGGDETNLPSVNASIVYGGLTSIAGATVPTSCDTIYAGATYDETYAEYLYAGSKGDNWPIGTIPIVCDAEAGAASTDTGTWASAFPTTAPTGATLNKLYTHCLVQFRYASSGTENWAGTFGIPLVGKRPGPNYSPYPNVAGFNSTLGYTPRARILLGQRFGWAVWAYIPMLLCSAYLTADAFVFLFAELFADEVLFERAAIQAKTTIDVVRESLLVKATSTASRRKRLQFGFMAFVSSLFMYILFIAGPWGILEGKLPRPHCESGKPGHGFKTTLFFEGTTGGWKADWDAQYFEAAAVVAQLVILLLLPLSSVSILGPCNRCLRRRTTSSGGFPIITGFVDTSKRYRRLQATFLPGVVIGGATIIFGQALAGARFGMAWAEGVVGLGDRHMFNEVELSAQIFDQTLANIYATVAIGLVLGAAMQRYLINGVGCYSFALFFLWVLFITAAVCLFILYHTVRPIFHLNDSVADCDTTFPDTGYGFERVTCRIRWGTFLGGAAIILIVMIIMTVLGCIDQCPNLFKTQLRANVKNEPINLQRNRLASQAGIARGDGSAASYNSDVESFFNFKTNVGELAPAETQGLLYSPAIVVGHAVRGKEASRVRFA